jgi:hypothetical protein
MTSRTVYALLAARYHDACVGVVDRSSVAHRIHYLEKHLGLREIVVTVVASLILVLVTPIR